MQEHVAAYLDAAAKDWQDVFRLGCDLAKVYKISKVAGESILAAVWVELHYRARAKPKLPPRPAASASARLGFTLKL